MRFNSSFVIHSQILKNRYHSLHVGRILQNHINHACSHKLFFIVLHFTVTFSNTLGWHSYKAKGEVQMRKGLRWIPFISQLLLISHCEE